MGKTIESKAGFDIDLSKVQDLIDEGGMVDDIDPDDLVIEEQDDQGDNKKRSKSAAQKKEEDRLLSEQFDKDYFRLGGIQHIICSATLTIDQKGRITPKKAKQMRKKKGVVAKKSDDVNATEQLCKILKFRTKHPKVVDLTVDDEKMPDTLVESAIRCKVEEKDLYMYYFLKQKEGQSTIIFSNSITCTKRLTNLLSFMKIKNYCLHSKMQQRQRLKNLDRFKNGVQACESAKDSESGHAQSSILVCTDVASRGLDIPYVQNVLHYQSPFNAEIYVHRCGRTARIGRPGESLALLGPEDEKVFKMMCRVLNKPADKIQMYSVSYTQIAKLEPLIESAKKFEAVLHQKSRDIKSANWLLNMAKDADLDLDDELRQELLDKTGLGSAKIDYHKKGKK